MGYPLEEIAGVASGDDQAIARALDLYELPPAFGDLYRRFVQEVVAPALGERELVIQRLPTFRVQRPDGVAVTAWHTDGDFGHAPTEINCWLPLTSASSSASVWMETQPGAGDFTPTPMRYGQLLLFDGAQLRHGNVPNAFCRTRVSFDFRVVPERLYRDRDGATVNAGRRFALGDYFDRLGALGAS